MTEHCSANSITEVLNEAQSDGQTLNLRLSSGAEQAGQYNLQNLHLAFIETHVT